MFKEILNPSDLVPVGKNAGKETHLGNILECLVPEPPIELRECPGNISLPETHFFCPK